MNTEELVSNTLYHALRERFVLDGWTPDVLLIPGFDSNDPDVAAAAATEYETQLLAIQNAKGFCVEVFGYSSNQYKDNKKIARVVLDVNQFIPSDIGNDTSVFYENISPSGSPKTYQKRKAVSLISDLHFTVYAVGSNSKQIFTLNQAIIETLPHRGYIKKKGETGLLQTGNYFMHLLDKGNTGELPIGIMERFYMYVITDLEEIPSTTLPGTTPGVLDINLQDIVEEPK